MRIQNESHMDVQRPLVIILTVALAGCFGGSLTDKDQAISACKRHVVEHGHRTAGPSTVKFDPGDNPEWFVTVQVRGDGWRRCRVSFDGETVLGSNAYK